MSMEMNKALVEQAGGDERAAFELFVRKHCGMPAHIAVNWDAKFTNDAWEGWKARAALEPSPVQAEQAEGAHVPDEVFAGVFAEWWEEEGQYCRAGGGDYERTFAFQAWRHLYPLLLQARAALAQPSPAQAEAERPEVVARVVHSNPVVLGQCGPLNANDELMTVAQHAASVARWAEMFNRVEQQRDAAMARVAELEAHCVRLGQGGAERYWENRWRDADARLQELEKQEPVATVAKVPGEDWNSLDFHRDLQDMQPGTKLYTAPVAQAQHSVPEISGIGRDAEHPRAVVLYLRNEPSEEDMRAIQNFLRAYPPTCSPRLSTACRKHGSTFKPSDAGRSPPRAGHRTMTTSIAPPSFREPQRRTSSAEPMTKLQLSGRSRRSGGSPATRVRTTCGPAH